MKYTIHSVSDSREHYKKQLRYVLRAWEEIDLPSVNGSDPDALAAAMERHPYEVKWRARVGQLGIWYSFLDALEHAPIVTFDDDAIVDPNLTVSFPIRTRGLDFDFFSLFIPRDSDHMHNPSNDVSTWATRVYSRYGGVSFCFSERGRDRIKALLERDGIRGQYDDTLYAYAKAGELDGFCSKPEHKDLVYITGQETSIVQESDYL